MRLSRHGRNFKRILYSPLSLIGLVVLSVILVRAAYGAYQTNKQNEEKFKGAVQGATEIQAREQFLENEIERLQSDRGVEEELRNKFPVAKEGESMVIIVEPENEGTGSFKEETKGFWERFLDLFR